MYISKRIEDRYFNVNHKCGRIIKKKFRKTWYKFKCDVCGQEYEKDKSNVGSSKRLSNDFKHFCKECFSYAAAADLGRDTYRKTLDKRVGERQVDSCGYMTIYVANSHPYSTGYCGRQREHILVMENHLQRSLQKGEVVHHLDGDKTNNDISNLDLCSVAEHNACHGASEEIVFELYKRNQVGYNRETKRYYLK